MSAIIIIDGRSTEATGSIIRKYRRMRGLTQEELGKQLKVRKSRISKIENNENLDTDTLINILKHLDVEVQLMVNSKTHSEMEEMYSFINACVDAFANAKGLSKKTAFNYLNLHKGIHLLVSCIDVEMTLPLNEILNDLVMVCRRNGGEIK
ncbi:MAG: DUF3791 domain-containing protein [Candidatus Cryptobacteroides sp.]